jgi:hypothetical protein
VHHILAYDASDITRKTNMTPAEENEKLRREVARLKHGAINRDFVQVNRKQIDKLNDLSRESSKAHYLLWVLVKAMDRHNALVMSQDSLMKLADLTRPTLQRAIALLREKKWVEVLKVGTTNVYRVNSSVFWTTRAGEKWASFQAEVIVNLDEQDKFTQADPSPQLEQVPIIHPEEDVIVAGSELGNDDPPEQSQLDFHA